MAMRSQVVRALITRAKLARSARRVGAQVPVFDHAPASVRPFSSEREYNAKAAARTLKLLERRKVSTLDIGILKRKGKPITMVTAYDYPSAVHVDLAGFDILLVGDSVGMVELVRACAYLCDALVALTGMVVCEYRGWTRLSQLRSKT